MSERKPCLRCQRGIDAWARICPYCNWDQQNTDPPPVEATAAPQYVAPKERNIRHKLIMAAGGVVLLLASFWVGALINSDDVPDEAPATIEEQAAEDAAKNVPKPRRADTALVPVNEPIAAAPITSAPVAVPAQGLPTEAQREDATAVSSVEYTQLAARAQAEQKAARGMVDPLSITGPAYAQQAPRRRTLASRTGVVPAAKPQQPMTSSSPAGGAAEPSAPVAQAPQASSSRSRTRPVPEYQPIPNISVSRTHTVRLDLTVGADGRVKEVGVQNPIPGQTARILATVQSWRFKPATENGTPVAAPFSVELSFRGND